MIRLALLLILAVAVVGCGSSSNGPSDRAATGYRFVRIASGFDSPVYVTQPTGVTNRLYVVEQTGRIRVVQGDRITGTLVRVPGVVSGGEQGLLSVAFHPRFTRNGRFFVYYTAPANRVVEYRRGRRVRTLLNVADPYSNHNGGQLMFGPDGRLYVGMGDSGSGGDPENRSQNPASKFGKLLAINVDRRGARWQMVALGLRNPWRYSFDRRTGDLYIGDVGQGSWEEIDFTPRRSPGLENYGWDVYEGRERFEDKAPSRGRLVFPVATYSLSGGDCAVIGGFVYRGRAVPTAAGRYFYGDNCSGKIRSFRIVSGRARSVRTEPFRLDSISSFGEDNAGELYAVTLDGGLWKLVAR